MSPNGERAGLDRAKERQVAWDSMRVRATEILDRSDPVGLIAIGAPAGEYEDLAIPGGQATRPPGAPRRGDDGDASR